MTTVNRLFVLQTDQDAQDLFNHLKAHWRACAKDGKPLAVEVLAHEKRRTTAQNKRYRAILQQIAEQAWIGKKQHPADSWHLLFKQEILGDPEARTSHMNVGDFAEFMVKVEVMAAQDLQVELRLDT